MFCVKKFDQADMELYKSSNQTVGNANFFKNKIPRLPEHYYDILEASSRREYTEEDQKEVIKRAMQEKKDYENKLMAEYQERENVVIDENTELKCKSVLYGAQCSELSDDIQSTDISQ